MLTCSKLYKDIPFAHRQHNHDGHCAFIHGHNWGIKFTFEADRVDANGFVVDFGKLKFIKRWIDEVLDHALLLNEGDPYREYLETVFSDRNTWDHIDADVQPSFKNVFAKIYIVPDASCEGLCQHIWAVMNTTVRDATRGRVWIQSVEIFEDERNSAIYTPER
ncbi:MAG: 6-carboxytetrahydropterin synthase [Actinobacteria bacterium]|nr:6-carboxytetrahydropterin synthase [Actinomycetota bacterium]MCA1806307.1 6-carboxytetrahydropterin synthase [Actinomycetota bacterium]